VVEPVVFSPSTSSGQAVSRQLSAISAQPSAKKIHHPLIPQSAILNLQSAIPISLNPLFPASPCHPVLLLLKSAIYKPQPTEEKRISERIMHTLPVVFWHSVKGSFCGAVGRSPILLANVSNS
jgi:hypothetical protein